MICQSILSYMITLGHVHTCAPLRTKYQTHLKAALQGKKTVMCHTEGLSHVNLDVTEEIRPA